MDKAEKQADRFDKVYEKAKAYLDKEINKIFDKFQRDYGLSENVARQVLKTMKDKKDLADLRRMLEARPNDPNIQQLLADLDSPAYSYRMKRLERLSDDLDLMRSSIYLSEKQGSDDFYGDLMKDSYYKAVFDLQQQTGLAYSFSDLPETEIKRLQAFKWTGEGYSDRIWSNTSALASSVKDELLVSLMTGRSTRATAQAIAERFEVGKGKARRLVRTESAFFHNQMELLSYEDAEITKYKFVAVLDKRTSHICQQHDNKVYNTDEAVPGVNYPPLHPWCRSTTIAHDDDIDYSKLGRRARNPETGKVEYVPADMSYKEWYDKYVAKDRAQVSKENDKTILRSNTTKLFSDVSNAWDEIKKGGLSKEQLVNMLESEYELGEFPSEITKLIGINSAYIDVSSLATSLVRHGQQYSLDEFMLIKEVVQKPYLILDNSERIEKSIVSYAKIPNKDKVVMEAVMVPRDEMLVIHFGKVGIRQVKKNEKNMLTLYKKEK
jgi:SPP1 gp7 family putative phage head morphogenesis protein